MLFKFLVGSPINNLQSGLILSQFGGLLMIFMAFIAGDKMDENGARYMFAGIGSIRSSSDHHAPFLSDWHAHPRCSSRTVSMVAGRCRGVMM